jgi:hypothetical protein
MGSIAEKFSEIFEAWGIEFSPDDIAARRPGFLKQMNGSGSVRYSFGSDERGEYLEFYAFHRIWGDHHARVYESGSVEPLDTLATMYIVDDDPEVTAQNERKMEEGNRKLLAELEVAGLLSDGPVPNSFTINAHLTSGAEERDED